MRKYVRDRKSGKRQAKAGRDILTLFFERPDVFGEEEIIDELLDFFLAGTLTT